MSLKVKKNMEKEQNSQAYINATDISSKKEIDVKLTNCN